MKINKHKKIFFFFSFRVKVVSWWSEKRKKMKRERIREPCLVFKFKILKERKEKKKNER